MVIEQDGSVYRKVWQMLNDEFDCDDNTFKGIAKDIHNLIIARSEGLREPKIDELYSATAQGHLEAGHDVTYTNEGWDCNCGVGRRDFGTHVQSISTPKRTTSSQTEAGKDPSVDHPLHYNTHPSGTECIEIVRHMGFNIGNVVKYLWRDGLKNVEVPLQDLEKALWYLKDEIEERKRQLAWEESLKARVKDKS